MSRFITVLKWFARILAALTILFMIMFSFDVFGGNAPAGKKLLGFLGQNIPAFVLIVALVIAWKNEITGGVIFILAFVALGIFFKSFSGNATSIFIILPLLLAGVAFTLSGMLSGRGGNKIPS
jgi:hypothetical protein